MSVSWVSSRSAVSLSSCRPAWKLSSLFRPGIPVELLLELVTLGVDLDLIGLGFLSILKDFDFLASLHICM